MSLSLHAVLSRREVERIHEKSLDLLERVGTAYNTPKALNILEQHGCAVDYDRQSATLPRDLVEWALGQAPRVVRLGARDPARDVVLDGRRSHHTTSSQAARAIVLETGERRASTAEDLRRGLLFADALDMIDIVNVMVAATDVPANVRVIRHFAMGFTQTSKHIRTGVLHAGQVPFIIDLAQAALGDNPFRPIFSVVYCTVTPLMHDGANAEAAIELVKHAVPLLIYPMPLAGGTSPVTLAGTILIHNVEFLSALTLFQLVNPGTPVIYGGGASQLDMLTGQCVGNARGRVMRLALRDVARFYNLPVNLGGLGTASSDLDAQYAHEATTACLLSYLAGADELYSMGLLAYAQYLSLEKMVLDNYLARQLEITLEPINVDDEHLQADLIERVGIGGHYLKQRETRAFTRKEFVPVWPPHGTDYRQLAREGAFEILHHHEPPPLPDGALDKFEEIVARAAGTLT